jgi:predicted CXXCH cytochrome family protein
MVLAVVVAVVLLTDGCTTTTKRQWLNFFFDGVPGGNQGTNAAAGGPATNVIAGDENEPVRRPAQQPPQPAVFSHPPYLEGKCAVCHESLYGETMKKFPDACFACHKDFLSGEKVKHQPVEDGECASCHSPHDSLNTNLLVKTGNTLCLTCHDDPLAGAKFKHEAVELGDCADCHTPHASNFKGRAPAGG